MKRFLLSVAAGVAGYITGAVVGYFLVSALSSNTHDRSVEAAMTAVFVFGPIGALIAAVVMFVRARAVKPMVSTSTTNI